uniref:DotA/TraY family protein n=1 Tax=Arcobacter sp. TaxID=1872629 RepID=UPI003D0B4311
EQGEKIYKKLKSEGALDYDRFNNIKNQKIKLDLIAAMHIATANHMLGGFINSPYDYGWEADEDYHYLEDNKMIFGFDFIKNGNAKNAAIELYKAHCSENWNNFSETRKFFNNYTKILNSNGDAKDLISSSGEINFECLIFDKKEEKFKYVLDDPLAFSDINSDNMVIQEAYAKNQPIFKNERYPQHLKNAQIELAVIDSYYYAVKYGVMKKLAEALKRGNDNSVLVRARQQGFAYLGSLMLDISNSQGNAKKYVETIQDTGTTSSKANMEGKGVRFENLESLIKKDAAIVNDSSESTLTSMNVGQVLTRTSDMTINSKTASMSDEAIEFGILENINNWIRNFIFSPLVYIQRGSGMETTDTLSESLEKCSLENDCVPSDSHPLNTLMLFGNDLISKSISIILVGMVADVLATATDLGGKKSGGSVGEGKTFSVDTVMKLFKNFPILKVLHYVALTISTIVSIISPVLYTLLFVGVFCSYLIPTFPYITFAIVFLGWLINIFVIVFVSPIWVLIMANINESGSTSISLQELWKKTGSVLLKPALMTIAMIFAWTLCSVAVFFINSTIYPVFATLSDSGFIVTDLITIAAVYILYITTIVIVLRHSFNVVAKFGDEVLQLINVQGTGDSGMVNNLGLERLLTAGQMAGLVQGGLTNLDKHARNKKGSVQLKTSKLRDKMKEKVEKQRELRKLEKKKREEMKNGENAEE